MNVPYTTWARSQRWRFSSCLELYCRRPRLSHFNAPASAQLALFYTHGHVATSTACLWLAAVAETHSQPSCTETTGLRKENSQAQTRNAARHGPVTAVDRHSRARVRRPCTRYALHIYPRNLVHASRLREPTRESFRLLTHVPPSGPFAGLLLADFGATVLRIDRAHPRAHTTRPPPPTPDTLVRRKTSIAVDAKSAAGLALLKTLIPAVDVLIDPFRPGVLEALGLDPATVLLPLNPRLVVARMTGFRRDGKYAAMAGHDINYIAVSGVLAMLGRAGEKPYAPGNLLGDFGGGGAVCVLGILLALLQRDRVGRGQVVEANMVDGAAFLGSMPRFARRSPMWSGKRGTNVLDGGAPFYDTYATRDGKFVAVGALEPQFYARLLQGLGLEEQRDFGGDRMDRATWATQRRVFTETFASRTRAEWEAVFDGTDACVTPVLEQGELEEGGFDQRPIVTLKNSPAFAIHQDGKGTEVRPAAEGQGSGVAGNGWVERGLSPGVGGEEVLGQWLGWKRGQQYEVQDGGLAFLGGSVNKAKL
nr:isopenicillin n epimerase component 2 [Quercus suber]